LPATLVGNLTLQAMEEDWRVTLRLLRVADASCVGTCEADVNLNHPAPGVEELLNRLMILLDRAGYERTTAPAWYRRPSGAQASNYLRRLEQQLAVVCSTHDGQITGEHEIIEGTIDLCVEHPTNAAVRMLLAQTLRQMKKLNPGLVAQYQARVDLLERESPILGEVGSCIARALA
jgi:hypothetical protein